LQKTLRDAWGLAVLILDILTTEDSMAPCAVAELLHGELPAEFRTIPSEELPDEELSGQERAIVLAALDGDTRSPCGGIGWIDEAIAWVETVTGRRVSSKSDVEQYNAGAGFTLVRLGVEGGWDYWLKATGAPNTHESQVTSLLSKLCRGWVPEVVAERQMRTVGAEADLLNAGALDHRTHVLRAEAEALFVYVDEAGAEMVIGAQLLPFQSHAWVEINGEVANDKPYITEIFEVLERC
jgi:hypothetical protein